MLLAALTVAAVVCGCLAIRARRLLIASIWLAAVSACTAGLLYAVGAREVAVIEVSVGVGLVTVLFVFAITMAGDPVTGAGPLVPSPVAWILIAGSVALLAGMLLPLAGGGGASVSPLAQALWQERGFDVLAQAVLIFSGVLGVLSLLSGEARR